MLTAVRFLQVSSLGVWLGALIFFSFLVAPAAFAVLPSRQLAGALVSSTLNRLYLMGYVCGVLYLLGVGAEQRLTGGSLRGAAGTIALVVVLLLLSLYSHAGLGAQMTELREQMQAAFGGVDQTPADHPLRVGFNRTHQVSVILLSLVMLGTLVLLVLSIRRLQ